MGAYLVLHPCLDVGYGGGSLSPTTARKLSGKPGTVSGVFKYQGAQIFKKELKDCMCRCRGMAGMTSEG